MSGRVFIFAGGGTGGHLYPALAVAEELADLRPDARIVFACSDRPIDRLILDPTPYAVVSQPVRPAPRLGEVTSFAKAYVRSALLGRDMVRDLRPAAVLGMGGFAAVPLVRAAGRAGVPTGLLNPDSVPGRANRMLARRVQAVFAQFPGSIDRFAPSVRPRVRPVGCPVRRSFFHADRGQGLAELGLATNLKTLLVLGGSLGAQSINQAQEALAQDLEEFADAWQVLHITGPQKGRQDDPPGGRLAAKRMEYCHRMDLAYAAADLAVCRAGASTVAELCAAGVPAVFLPYPYHADRHQQHNAAPLVKAGAAIIVEDRIDPQANARALREALLPLMSQPGRLEAMASAARAAARPAAAMEVARWLARIEGSG